MPLDSNASRPPLQGIRNEADIGENRGVYFRCRRISARGSRTGLFHRFAHDWPGAAFFAVKGERLDGHDYVGAALEKGAVAAIVRKDQLNRYSDKTRLLAVDDTLTALQTLATAVRKVWGKPLVGVTGSAGKTTTKEAIAHVLASRFRVLKSEGNFNNHFGLPLMLLKLEPEHEVAVIEMGMSHAGEIRALAKIAQPEIGVVTNVAPVHLEFLTRWRALRGRSTN